MLVGAAAFVPPQARAADAPISSRDADAARQTHLADVETGDATVDETTRLGLEALSRVLGERTSAQIAAPIAVDPARDDLSFYPLLYWPIVADGRSRRPPRWRASRRS